MNISGQSTEKPEVISGVLTWMFQVLGNLSDGLEAVLCQDGAHPGRDELEGYQGYAQQTHYRLLPGVW